VKIPVLRKGRAGSVLNRAAAHAHRSVPISRYFLGHDLARRNQHCNTLCVQKEAGGLLSRVRDFFVFLFLREEFRVRGIK